MAERLNLQTDVLRLHTVPRFLLKHFSTPVKGKRLRLFAYDKAAGRAYATTPDDATVRNTFYNLDDHPERPSLEPLLGIYEHEAAPVIAGLLRHKDIHQLTQDDRYKLAVFVAVQRARTFGELERISGMISVLFRDGGNGRDRGAGWKSPGLIAQGRSPRRFFAPAGPAGITY